MVAFCFFHCLSYRVHDFRHAAFYIERLDTSCNNDLARPRINTIIANTEITSNIYFGMDGVPLKYVLCSGISYYFTHSFHAEGQICKEDKFLCSYRLGREEKPSDRMLERAMRVVVKKCPNHSQELENLLRLWMHGQTK